MERLTAAWEKYRGAYENPKAEEELNIALDDLAVSQCRGVRRVER